MRNKGTIFGLLLIAAIGAIAAAGAWADGVPEADAKLVIEVASAQVAAPAPAPKDRAGLDLQVLSQRLESLEKQNLVLREDLGKARLDARTELAAMEQRHAAKIAELNRELDRMRDELAAEKEAHKRRNRDLWFAVGAVAVGLLMAN